MQVKIITIPNGLIIIGSDVSKEEDKIILQKPAQIILQQSPEGMNMGFLPYQEFCEEWERGMTFNTSDVLLITTPVPQLLNQYNKAFGSGIEIVTTLPGRLK